jgi:hypothetical protein
LNSRWIARIVGILLLLAFIILMADLQSRLVRMQRTKDRPAPAGTR